MSTASLWAATPGYAQQIPSPKAALALVRRVTDILGVAAPVTSLADEISDYEEQVEEMISGDDDLPSYVRRLEQRADLGEDDDDDDDDEDLDDDSDDQVRLADVRPSLGAPIDAERSEQLIEELEQFLRDQGDTTS
jgi:hypothetical protein